MEKVPPYFRPDDWPNGKGMRYDAGRRLFEIGISWRGKGIDVQDNVRALEEGVVPAEAMENVLRYVELNGIDTSKFRKDFPRPPEKLGPPLKEVPGHSFGAMLDISRDKVPKMETLKWFVDVLAKLGYNEFQLYTENTFAYSKHAVACAETSPMTAEEIRELDDYCYGRGIVLTPNQNSFGHMERWLAHKEYLPIAEKTNGLYTVLGLPNLENRPAAAICPTNPKALEFIDGLYAELLPNFRHAKVLNVGCDETWDIFDKEGCSAAAVREKGFDGVYVDHLNNLAALAGKRGFRISYWADMIIFYPDRVAKKLPKDAIALMWGYGDEESSPGLTAEYEGRVQMLKAAGAEVTVCPSTRTFGGWATDPDRVRGNTELMAYVARKYGLKGYLMTIWGDGGQRAPYLSEVVGLAVAAIVVRGEKADDAKLADEIDRVLGCKVGAAMIAFGKLDAIRRGCRSAEEKAKGAQAMRRILDTVDRASLSGPVANGIDTLYLAADKLEAESRGAKPDEMDALVSRYRELWLRDYRPGGLDHSVMSVFKTSSPRVAASVTNESHRSVVRKESAAKASAAPVSDAEANGATEMNRTETAPTARRVNDGGVRVLFIGNSITLHSPAPSIGWTNNWGMAASAAERDYVHLVSAGIERETERKADVMVRNLCDFERNFETYDFSKIDDLVAFRPDYLVVALGENVRNLTNETDRAAYRDAFKKLLSRFADGREKPHAVVRGVFWPNPAKDALMSQAASELGMAFVTAPRRDATMTAAGLFVHAGVAAHPGDKGMAMIAAAVLDGFFPKRPHAADEGTASDGRNCAATRLELNNGETAHLPL